MRSIHPFCFSGRSLLILITSLIMGACIHTGGEQVTISRLAVARTEGVFVASFGCQTPSSLFSVTTYSGTDLLGDWTVRSREGDPVEMSSMTIGDPPAGWTVTVDDLDFSDSDYEGQDLVVTLNGIPGTALWQASTADGLWAYAGAPEGGGTWSEYRDWVTSDRSLRSYACDETEAVMEPLP